jgi:hypothetical protein
MVWRSNSIEIQRLARIERFGAARKVEGGAKVIDSIGRRVGFEPQTPTVSIVLYCGAHLKKTIVWKKGRFLSQGCNGNFSR